MINKPSREDVLKVAGEPVDWLYYDKVARIFKSCQLYPREEGAFPVYTEAAVLAVAEALSNWKERVIDQLVICHILSAEHEADPVKALNDLISWHVQVALDPLVSSDAAALVAAGAADMRERAALACDEQADEPECQERAEYCADAIRALPITTTEGEQG